MWNEDGVLTCGNRNRSNRSTVKPVRAIAATVSRQVCQPPASTGHTVASISRCTRESLVIGAHVFQDAQLPARCENPPRLPQGGSRIRHRAEHQAEHRGVHAVAGRGQVIGQAVGDLYRDRAVRRGRPGDRTQPRFGLHRQDARDGPRVVREVAAMAGADLDDLTAAWCSCTFRECPP
jgi:hypothetical protein